MEPGERPLLEGVIEQQVVDRHRDGEHEDDRQTQAESGVDFLGYSQK
jgi:hypothetical protein